MQYQDFIPKKYLQEAIKKGVETAEYTWNQSKEYRTLWGQRIKAERYMKDGEKGSKPKQ